MWFAICRYSLILQVEVIGRHLRTTEIYTLSLHDALPIYYERVNVIPKVTRTSGGIRDYQEEDLRWVELAVCMRNAGLPIESLIEYQRLFRAGDSTIPARLELLNEQMDILQKQKEQIEETMDRLSYKISRYEEAVKTGKLVWTKEE